MTMKYPILAACVTLFWLGSVSTEATSYSEECLHTESSWRPCGTCWSSLDYLYWRPCVDGIFDYLESDKWFSSGVEDIPFLQLKADSKTKCPTNDYESGLRLGCGYQSPCSGWGAAVKWTHYEPRDFHSTTFDFPDPALEHNIDDFSHTVTPFGGFSFLPALNTATDGKVSNAVGLAAKGKWKLHLDVLDIEFGKYLTFGECIHLRPHLDIRFARLKQRLRVKSSGVLIGQMITNTGFEERKRFKEEFKGGGLRVGLDALIDLFCGWGVYADFACSLLYGERNASFRDEFMAAYDDLSSSVAREMPVIGSIQSFGKSRNNYDKYCLRPITDAAVGLYWETYLCNCYHFIGKVGWEHHYFFSQGLNSAFHGNKFFSYDEDDLSMYGFTVSANFAY